MIGSKAVILGREHGSKVDTSMNQQSHTNEVISIGNDIWIGANVTILKDVSVSDGTIIGSVVVKDITAYSIAVGNPAKIVKFRGEG